MPPKKSGRPDKGKGKVQEQDPPKKKPKKSGKGKEKVQEEEPPKKTPEQRHSELLERRHGPSTYVDMEFLRSTRFYDRLVDMVTAAGWPDLLTIVSETDIEDVCEFLAWFHYERGWLVRYRHRGVMYVQTLNQVREIMNWPIPDEVDDMNWVHEWSWSHLVSGKDREPSAMNATRLIDPALYYMQKLVSRTIFARDNSHLLSLFDLRMLEAFAGRHTTDFAHWWFSFLGQRPAAGKLTCGGLITYFLRRAHGQASLPEHRLLAPRFLTRSSFAHMKAIHSRKSRPEQFVWIYHDDPQYHEQMPTDRRRRSDAPPEAESSRAAARRTARRYAEDEAESSRAAESRYRLPREELDRIYNERRYLKARLKALMPRGVQLVHAPEGWDPDMPIRPEDEIDPDLLFRREDETDTEISTDEEF